MVVAVGIDLGTTNSCVAVYGTNGVEVLANEIGDRVTPSFVLLKDDECVVGKGAKTTTWKNNTNLVYDAKRIIGKSYSDSALQAEILSLKWPFSVKDDGNDSPNLYVDNRGFSAEQISAYVLGHLKHIVEEHYLGHNQILKKAVITVPAYFNDNQRAATKTAAELAGLEVLLLLSEPSAAGLAFCYQRFKENLKDERKVLVYDLGGGTFDVSIMKIASGRVEILAISGDTNLGGNDFDERLKKLCIEKFKNQTGEDVSENKKALWKLRQLSVKAKEHLTTYHHFEEEVDSLQNEENFDFNIKRSEFDESCQDLFDVTIKIVDNALKDAKLSPANIDEVLLVGGSSRIPRIQEMLKKKFGENKINKTINADEAVAYGAAIQAAIITGEIEKQCNIVLMDVTPLSIGVNTTDDGKPITSVIIPRNSKIPTKRSRIYLTTMDNQIRVTFKILEGEHLEPDKNHCLGQLFINDLPPMAKGAEIEVTFELDSNAILHITAKLLSNEKTVKADINYNKQRLNPEDVTAMLKKINVNK